MPTAMVHLLLPLLGGLASSATVGGAPPRYILFARPPGSAFNQNNPSSLSPSFLAKPLVGIGAAASPQHDLLIGSEVIFSLMQSPEPVLLASLNAVLNASVASGVPISLVSWSCPQAHCQAPLRPGRWSCACVGWQVCWSLTGGMAWQ